jgi:hypothetical protein
MNEPHENLDHDPFADDAQRRPSRLRRSVLGTARPRPASRSRCALRAAAATPRLRPLRHVRPCPRADRAPLR